jgi:hypothetical protein
MMCALSGIELSNRIKGLGPDFALLIPDYETDLYYFPDLADHTWLGATYDKSDADTPLKMMFTGSGAGIIARYWPDYKYKYDGNNVDWQAVTNFKFNFTDLWFLKVKHDTWDLRNDGLIDRTVLNDANNGPSDNLTIKYFLNTNEAFSLGAKLRLNFLIGSGFYLHTRQFYSVYTEKNMIWLNSLRPGLFYRDNRPDSSFTSAYVEIGGPINWSEYDALPFSLTSAYDEPLSGMPDVVFLGAVWSRLGWARGISLNGRGHVCYGLKESFVYQKVGFPYRSEDCFDMNNALTLQIAFEYPINRISIRCGNGLHYNLDHNRITSVDYNGSQVLVSEDITHHLYYQYSFGLGWQPWDKFKIDILTKGVISLIYEWSLAFYYIN